MQWYSMDLHLHTPASSDYQIADATYLDVLKRAEARGLDMIAFADHNTVAGYRALQDEVEQLRLLQRLKRILPEEEARLGEYERLLGKIKLLPGFEFTATFGFHILGIFSPEKPVREIEHLLLSLNIPPDQLDEGSATVGASADVLTAYRLINEAGGIAIAAHANSTNGVAMRGFAFGGQTKIAYTQDPNLHALEVTDLDNRSRRSTARFFSGTKPEYPRRMHAIQGSDAHRLEADPSRQKNLGVGDRVTEVLLPEVSFEALKDLFVSNDFARTRPRRMKQGQADFDFVRSARDEGSNIIQDFHENITKRGGNLYAVIADVCAFANTNGGTLYLGLSADPKQDVVGIKGTARAISDLESEISNRISPPLQCTVDAHKTGGKDILRVLVPRGEDPPYAVDDNKIYVRAEAETGLAVRDEIVELVNRKEPAVALALAIDPQEAVSLVQPLAQPQPDMPVVEVEETGLGAPRTGVEVVGVNERNNTKYYTVRDLRNGSMVKNVTQKSARSLWAYAISSYDKMPEDRKKAASEWSGDLGLLRSYKQGKTERYDLVQRDNGNYRFYFGVTDDGIHSEWSELVGAGNDE